MTAQEFVKQYCEASGWTETEFYETQVPMPDDTSPTGWAAVSNSPLAIKAHVDLHMQDETISAESVTDDESESEMKWRDLALQFDGHRMQSLCFLKYILSQLPETEFVEAREFMKSGPLAGEEVLRNRIAAMLKAEPVTGWIKCSERLPDNKEGLWSKEVIALSDLGEPFKLSAINGCWQRTQVFIASGATSIVCWMPLPASPENEV